MIDILLKFDPSLVEAYFTDILQSELAKFGVVFLLASWVHSGRVKKEIRLNFKSLTDAINNVAVTLKNDLDSHGKRLDSLSDRVENLEKQTAKSGG